MNEPQSKRKTFEDEDEANQSISAGCSQMKRPRNEEDNDTEKGSKQQHSIEVINTKRGSLKFLIDGYSYVKKKAMKNNKQKYECTDRQKLKCNAYIMVENDQVLTETIPSTHRHAPDAAIIETLKIKEIIKNKAMNTLETPQMIIQTVASINMDASIAANLPSIENIKRNVRSIRQNMNGKSSNDMNDMTDKLSTLPDGTSILLYNSFMHFEEKNKNQMLIFGTTESIDVLKNSPHWFADGTFDVCPRAFYQVYTIHAIKNGSVFPCLYILLSNKKQSMYQDLFSLVKEMCALPNPETITVDFEMAAINAFHETFSETLVCGCFYHFTQSLYRKIQQLGLQKPYAQDKRLSQQFKMFGALAYIPVPDVPAVFNQLVDSMKDCKYEKMKDFIKYFRVTYIGSESRKPNFPIELWNVRYQIDNELPKTNNSVEGFNNKLTCAVGCTNPSLSTLIGSVKRVYQETTMKMLQNDMEMDAGKKLKSEQKRKRLADIVTKYKDHHPLYFLGLIGANIKM